MIYTTKILGAVIIFAAVFLIVYLRLSERKKRLEAVSDFISSLKYIQDLIAHTASPFYEIAQKVYKNANGSRNFFGMVLKGLEKAENPALSDVWQEATELFCGENRISPGGAEIIKALGNRLGKMTVEIEGENISYALDELKKEEMRLCEEYGKEAMLLKRLSVALSGFIVLILI